MITKGDWKVKENSLLKTRPYMVKEGEQVITNVNSEANAHLIVAAVNACQKVNPDNPQAAAEALSLMYEALKVATARIHNQIRYETGEMREQLQKELSQCLSALAAEG